MDPDEVWRIVCESLRDLNQWPESTEVRQHALECLEDLTAWIRKGGFPPTIGQ